MIASRKRRRYQDILPFGSTLLVPSIHMYNSHLQTGTTHISKSSQLPQFQTRTLNLFSRMPQSFFACVLLGYSIFRFPLLATICSAVNGLLVYLHLESDHHFFTAATSSRNICSSVLGSTPTLPILLAAIMQNGRVEIYINYDAESSYKYINPLVVMMQTA